MNRPLAIWLGSAELIIACIKLRPWAHKEPLEVQTPAAGSSSHTWTWVAREGVKVKWLWLNSPCNLLLTLVSVQTLVTITTPVMCRVYRLGLQPRSVVHPGHRHLLLEAFLNRLSPLSSLNMQGCLLRAWDSVPFMWLQISDLPWDTPLLLSS